MYLDNIQIFSKSLEEHKNHICQVLQTWRMWFLQTWQTNLVREPDVRLSFFGFIVEQGQLRADPAKIKAVVERPEPQTRKQLQVSWFRQLLRTFYSRL